MGAKAIPVLLIRAKIHSQNGSRQFDMAEELQRTRRSGCTMAATARRIRLRSYLSAGQKTSKRRRAIKGIVQSVWPKHPYILHNNRQYSAFKSEIATQSYMACVDTSSAEDGTTERSGYRTDMPVGGYKDTSRKMPDWKQQDAAERMAHAEHKADHQLVVPQTLRQDILQCLHSGPEDGHLGKKKTLWKIRQRFYWPDLSEDVADWCRKCPECNQRKSGNKHHRGQLEPQIAPYPMSRIGVDIIGPFQQTERENKYILTVQDYFSKWPEAYPIPDMTASTVARTLVNEFICRYGARSRYARIRYDMQMVKVTQVWRWYLNIKCDFIWYGRRKSKIVCVGVIAVLETVGTVIPVPEDQQCGIFETAFRHGSTQ
ncbi:Retrovirus-related Pol polyprotein from transposon [Trichinella murrelli]|uniref:Retrovirus-related Pol polyprotein from transposon n=1 Tax=Trichinella murrelli TaxID=144512 RepID=A0A0V0TVB6_9BILA|nr:Retrovirus-related Pol polyprotein from transposon [Trichinella murrelli]